MKFEAPRGTQDVLESEQPKWRYVISQFEELCDLYGYKRIETPVFEDTELFVRTSGIGSDVVSKEMYTFEDRRGRSLTLRPEATAPIVRAYFNHGLHREVQPQKLYTVATIYRYGRPQKGRFREHRQLDVEAIGSDDPAIDAEVIQLYAELLKRVGVLESDYHLELNSIGDQNCRPQYIRDELGPWLEKHFKDLDEETREQAARNPLRVLDNILAKPPAVRELLWTAPAIGDFLCPACEQHFSEVRAYLKSYSVNYKLVPTLVRGLDYYTRTTWEFVGPEGGSQSTLSGGGRYDGLAEQLGAPPTPGVGFGAGVERLLIALGPAAHQRPSSGIDVYFAFDTSAREDAALRQRVLAEFKAARDLGLSTVTDYAYRSLNSQFDQAHKLDARLVVIVWGSGAGGVTIRRHRGDEWPVSIQGLAETLFKELRT